MLLTLLQLFGICKVDHNYYKNRIPHETSITSWIWEARNSLGTIEMFASRSDEFQGLSRLQKWKPLTNICKDHYIWMGKNLGSVLIGSQPYSSSLCVVSRFVLYFCFRLYSDLLLLTSVSPLWPHEEICSPVL